MSEWCYEIPVKWEMSGYVTVVAANLELAKSYLIEDSQRYETNPPRVHSVCVEGSFKIDEEALRFEYPVDSHDEYEGEEISNI